MLKHIFSTLVIATSLLSFDASAAGEPRCGLFACATFSVNTYGITEVVFTSRVAQELDCWVKVQATPVKFKLQKKSRVYSAGYGFLHSQFSWRCDLA
ncbi:RNA-binding protein [Paraglaciecola hydrolytica]|uniref:Uncharacterized protein n=1 Tax=Paraglaciecola hydrolytica TaxID=1799789 RepID=A0A135ZZQ1_9ALTE|nr:hypothetical protein [Paraglaciecola hydrolytica]KXI28455.1 hypothetical protein AX660_15275 [Paraglaciecola hydrolytica]